MSTIRCHARLSKISVLHISLNQLVKFLLLKLAEYKNIISLQITHSSVKPDCRNMCIYNKIENALVIGFMSGTKFMTTRIASLSLDYLALI